PLGRFVYKHDDTRPAYFYSTGTGLAPLLSMIQNALLEKNTDRELKLYQGVRYQHDLFLDKELQELGKRYPNFKYYFYVSRPDDKWLGYRGYMNQHILAPDFDNEI